jgi:hypothetical protein
MKRALLTCALFAALLLTGSAKAESITGSATVGYSSNGCTQSQAQTSPVFVGIFIGVTTCLGFPEPPVTANVLFQAFSGSAALTGCGVFTETPPPIVFLSATCSVSLSLSGDYYFAGSGLGTFDLGVFSAGVCCSTANFVLTIDGQTEPLVPSFPGPGRSASITNLQLGEFHHITLSASMSGPDSDGFSYNLASAGILGPDVNPPPVPEPSAFLLCAGGLLVVLKRVGYPSLLS